MKRKPNKGLRILFATVVAITLIFIEVFAFSTLYNIPEDIWVLFSFISIPISIYIINIAVKAILKPLINEDEHGE